MQNAKSVVKRYIENMVSTGYIDELSTVIADDYVDEYSKNGRERGPAVAKDHIVAVRSTYPDLKVEVVRQYCDGDTVITTFKATATHAGKWLNIPPTNKKIEIEGVNIDRVVDGKIVSHNGFANTFEALVKINALPGVGLA